MDTTVQCPVCTLYLHEGMALSAHLDTHPKDQVISALCNLAAPSSGTPSTISTPAPSQSSLTFSTPSLSSTPAPPPYNHIEHTHRSRPRAPYTPASTPSTTPLSFSSDHSLYFLPQQPRTYSRHGDNSTFLLNNKFQDNDGLIMAFVQPTQNINLQQQQEAELINNITTINQQYNQQQQQQDTKPPMHLIMPINTAPPANKQQFYKQQIKKYTINNSLSDEHGVVVVVGGTSTSNNSNNNSHSDAIIPVISANNNNASSNVGNIIDINKNNDNSNTCSSSKSGVKILSNIKLELPIQTIPEIIDLTSTTQQSSRTHRPDLQEDEAILPDFVDAEMCHNYTQARFRDHYSNQLSAPSSTSSSPLTHKLTQSTSSASGSVVNTFSVIKNIGNPNLYKDTSSSSQHSIEESNKINNNTNNSILPDLTCNENPSISPCSELTNDSNELSITYSSNNDNRRTIRIPTTPIAMYPNRFTTVACDAPITANNNILNKNNKMATTANSSNSIVDTITANSNNFNLDISPINNNQLQQQDNASNIGRLDGFFKEFERNKHSNILVEKQERKTLIDEDDEEQEQEQDQEDEDEIDDDNDSMNSCQDNMSKDTMVIDDNRSNSPIIIHRRNSTTNNNSNIDHLKNSLDDCAMGVDKLIDNLTQKSYTEMENMRPVNVIAFGSMLPANNPSTSSYNNYFNKASKDSSNILLQWETNHTTQKEEFALTTFIDVGHAQYGTNEAQLTTDGAGLQSYTEIGNSGSKPLLEDGGRGELSEHDTPWPGMYCDVGGSTSYDLLARETWHSDGSDVDMPVTPIKDAYNDAEDIPIVVGVKPPERNYRCGTCGKTFNCPKERRVHRAKEHPIAMSQQSDDLSVMPEIQQSSLLTVKSKASKKKVNSAILKPTQIKNEVVKMEISTTTTTTSLKQEINNSNVLESVGLGIHFEDKKPKLEDVSVAIGVNDSDRIGKKRKREWICGTCKQEFPGQQEYNEHLKEHPLECLTCGKYFYRRSNMQLHIKRHLGIKNYKCEVCEKRFITKQKMLEHYYVHTGNTPIKCGLCPETFRRHSNMVQHRNKHHFLLKKKLRDYVCHCGEVFHTKKKLAWHKEIHEERPKACPHCSEKFIHAASLSRHMRRAHNTLFTQSLGTNAECGVCHQVYLRTSLESHMRTHAGARPYSCHICNKAFTTKWNLKLHRWTHANRSSKPYKCSLCKGAFIRHADYVSHMNSHKSVRPYTCNYCGCQFIRKYNCQRHVKEHENDKKFTCQVPDCGKSFHRSYYLAEHMRVHSGHRPFACNICGKTSSTKSNHNKHVKIHHAREPVTTEG